jgi:hypothetical protein
MSIRYLRNERVSGSSSSCVLLYRETMKENDDDDGWSLNSMIL